MQKLKAKILFHSHENSQPNLKLHHEQCLLWVQETFFYNVNQPEPKIWHFTNLPKTDKMDAKLYCLTVAFNTTLVLNNFPMNKGSEQSPLWGRKFHELLRNPCEAANSLHSPGNPSYQKHLKNFSTTIKLTWMETEHLKYTIYGMKHGQTHKYKLTRSLDTWVHNSASTIPKHQQQKDPPVTCSAMPKDPRCLLVSITITGFQGERKES